MLPYLLLDQRKCQSNIDKMLEKATKMGVSFRPHFKTHQSATIGSWFGNKSSQAICVSSLKMAEYFAANGWIDITISIPINPNEHNRTNKLASTAKINLLVESIEVASTIVKNIHHKVGVFVKIDCGYHRTGISADNIPYIRTVLSHLQHENIHLRGFLSHFGNTYSSSSPQEVKSIYSSSIQQLLELKAQFIPDYPNLQLSIGDTPSCSIVDDFEGADEIRPGNFVFYDVMQWKLGSCHVNDIAVALIVPVLAKHAHRNEIVIHGGAIHLSKEFTMHENGEKMYGLVCRFTNGKWTESIENAYVCSLSQEHGIIKLASQELEKTQIGELLAILPVHSCLTANLMNGFQTLDGQIIRMML